MSNKPVPKICGLLAAALLVFSAGAHAAGPGAKPAGPLAAKAQGSDLFTGGVWHASGGTWPGTLSFDSAKQQVVLAPLGAPAITATYKVKLDKQKDKKTATGNLHMTSTDGQVVEAAFVISDTKNLTLAFKGGQKEESYLKMTPEEEAAEVRRIEQLVRSGKINPAQIFSRDEGPLTRALK